MTKQYKQKISSKFPAFVALIFVAGLTMQVLLASKASAAQITARSLTLEAGATDGGSKPGGTVKHYFQFAYYW
jgi:hypothetical protein